MSICDRSKPTDCAEQITLCPAQQATFDWFGHALELANIFVLWAGSGRGETTILQKLHGKTGGAFLSMKDYMRALGEGDPLAMEETVERLILDAFAHTGDVMLDE